MKLADGRRIEPKHVHEDLIGVLSEQRSGFRRPSGNTCDAYGRARSQMSADTRGVDAFEDVVGIADARVPCQRLAHGLIRAPADAVVLERLAHLLERPAAAPGFDQGRDPFTCLIAIAFLGEIQAQLLLEPHDLLFEATCLDEVLPLAKRDARNEDPCSVPRGEIPAERAVEVVAEGRALLVK